MTLPPRLHAYATRLLIGTILAVEQATAHVREDAKDPRLTGPAGAGGGAGTYALFSVTDKATSREASRSSSLLM
jgi:hypothetical protein